MTAAAPPAGPVPETRAATGIEGFDDILGGGFPPHRLYLLEGVPGSGKTTLALQFLMDGARKGEPVLYVTLSETEEELRAVAASHGWSLEGITIRELVASEDSLRPDEQYTMFHPSEVELSETTKTILADVERIRPARVVFDSLSELRLLAASPLRYRRQILALKQFFGGRSCTVLLLDDLTGATHDLQVQSIAHGAVRLEQMYPEYGSERRRLIVLKVRGARFRGGYHDYIIRRGGIEVFPRLIAGEHRPEPPAGKLAERHRRAGCPARWRNRARDQHPHRRGGGDRQVLAGGAICRGGGYAGWARGALHLRREHPYAPDPVCGARDRPAAARGRGAGDRAAGGPRRAVARRVGPRHSAGGRAGRNRRRHRQSERLPQRDARRALPHHPAPRAVDVPRPDGRRHDPHRRPSWVDRQPDGCARGRELPGGRRDPDALLRDEGGGPSGALGRQEARRCARALHPRVPAGDRSHHPSASRCGTSAACLPGCR